MESLVPFLELPLVLVSLCIAFLAGIVKGTVGFAMPMITYSGLSLFLDPQLALAGLILPTVVTNVYQALRQGAGAAWHSVREFRVFLIVGGVFLVASSQLVRIIPQNAILLIVGGPIVLFAVVQLLGLPLLPHLRKSWRVEAPIAAVAGFFGGMSGIWGPPTVAYLTALDTPKRDHVRIQGVIYGSGAVALLAAHIGSGVLRVDTAPFSAILILPALLGMWIGGRVQDRVDQHTFKKLTLLVLLIAGLNLVRRGVFG